jgi:hypothetical protein
MSDLFALIILAHSFYSDACCSGNDCRPVPCDQIVSIPDGWKWHDITFHKAMLRIAPDGGCHVCVAAGPVCIYLPPRV